MSKAGKQSGWAKLKDQSVKRRIAKQGTYELNVDAYNERLRNATEFKKKWCENRRKVDELNLDRQLKDEIKEVWD